MAVPEFWGEVQPPASLKGLDIPSRRAVLSRGNRAEGRHSEWETRLFVEEPMLSTGLHFASESTPLHDGECDGLALRLDSGGEIAALPLELRRFGSAINQGDRRHQLIEMALGTESFLSLIGELH